MFTVPFKAIIALSFTPGNTCEPVPVVHWLAVCQLSPFKVSETACAASGASARKVAMLRERMCAVFIKASGVWADAVLHATFAKG